MYSFFFGAIICGGGLSILLCPRKTKYAITSYSWEAMKIYVQLEDFCLKKIKPYFLKDINLDDSGDFKITLYNCNLNSYENYIDVIPSVNTDWFFIKRKIDGEYKCRIFENIELANTQTELFIKTDKLFIQIELKQNNKTFDIKEAVEYFMIEKNKIFNKRFLMWIMEYWFNVKLSDDYKIKIIDSNVNIVNLDKNKYILLYKEEYNIKDITI